MSARRADDRLSVFSGWIKQPCTHGRNRIFVETGVQSFYDFHLLRPAFFVNFKGKNDRSHDSRGLVFIRIRRLNAVFQAGRNHSRFANVVNLLVGLRARLGKSDGYQQQEDRKTQTPQPGNARIIMRKKKHNAHKLTLT